MLIVATATAKEMKAAFAFAPDAPTVDHWETEEFELNGRKLLLTVTGVGLVNAAMATGRLVGRPGISGVLNLGIAGAYDTDEFPLASVTHVWREIWPEYGLLDENGFADPKGLGFSQGHIGGDPVWDRVKLNPVNDAETMNLSLPENSKRASSISLSSVTSTDDRAGWLKANYSADIENMEGFAMAFGVKQKGLPFLELRTVSNLVGSRFTDDWDLKGAFKNLGDATKHLFGA